MRGGVVVVRGCITSAARGQVEPRLKGGLITLSNFDLLCLGGCAQGNEGILTRVAVDIFAFPPLCIHPLFILLFFPFSLSHHPLSGFTSFGLFKISSFFGLLHFFIQLVVEPINFQYFNQIEHLIQ